MKNTITEIKSTLEGINSILNDAEEWISKLEDRVVEIIDILGLLFLIMSSRCYLPDSLHNAGLPPKYTTSWWRHNRI